MPILTVATNVIRSAIPVDLAKKLCVAASQATGKPLANCLAFVSGDQVGSFGGSDDPCALVEFQSIGGFNDRENEMAQIIGKVITEELNVKQERFYVKFVKLTLDDIAYKGVLKSNK